MNAILEHDGRTATFRDCDPNDCVEAALLRGEWYDLPLLELLQSLNAAGNYLDVGAYVGTFSVFAGLFCPAERIFAIEPQPDIHRKLAANLDANGIKHADVYPVAIANRAGLGQMTAVPGNRGGAKLESGNGVGGRAPIGVFPLDCLRFPNVTVAKIDVEGAELDVLRGGLKTIRDSVEHLFIEVWPRETCLKYGIDYTGEQVADVLIDAGFSRQREMPGDNHYWRKVR